MLRLALPSALALALASPALAAEDAPLLFTGFTLIDPDTRTATVDSWVVVRDGRIELVGQGEPPAGEYERHAMDGLYALSGLIDAHGHITAGPQRVSVVDGAPRIEIRTGDEFSRLNGAVALAFGATTVRDPGGAAEPAARYDAMVARGEWVGPEALHAGEILQPPPFVGQSFAYPTSPAEWDAEAARQAAFGMTYFKLYTGLAEDEIALGAAAAKRHGLIPIAHLAAVSWTRALELGVEQFEHALPTSPALLEPEARARYAFGADYMTRWWELAELDGPLMRDLVAQLAVQGAIVDLTLVVNEMIYHAGELEERFPEMAGELPDYLHPEMLAALAPNYAAMAAVPPEQLERGKAVWPKVLAFAKLLHQSGVKLMIGTDGTGGSSLHHELANHVEAGIPAWEVLRMVTSGNAALLGLTDTGRIAPGMEADIVFLKADPVADVGNVEQVAFVVSNGALHAHDALLDIARGIAAAARERMEERSEGE